MAANFNMIFTSALLFVLIICSNGIMFIEGRALLINKTKRNIKKQAVNDIVINSSRYILEVEAEPSSSIGESPSSRTAAVQRVSVEKTDDYRPTEPGHSPGAGHSVATGVEGPN